MVGVSSVGSVWWLLCGRVASRDQCLLEVVRYQCLRDWSGGVLRLVLVRLSVLVGGFSVRAVDRIIFGFLILAYAFWLFCVWYVEER